MLAPLEGREFGHPLRDGLDAEFHGVEAPRRDLSLPAYKILGSMHPRLCFDGHGNVVAVYASHPGVMAVKFHPVTGRILYERQLSDYLPSDVKLVGGDYQVGHFGHQRSLLILFDVQDHRFLLFTDEPDTFAFYLIKEVHYYFSTQPKLVVDRVRQHVLLFSPYNLGYYLFSLGDHELRGECRILPSTDLDIGPIAYHDGMLGVYSLDTRNANSIRYLHWYRTCDNTLIHTMLIPQYYLSEETICFVPLGPGLFLNYVSPCNVDRVQNGPPRTIQVTAIGPAGDLEIVKVHELAESFGNVQQVLHDLHSGRLVLSISTHRKRQADDRDACILVFQPDLFAPRQGFQWGMSTMHLAPRPMAEAILTVTMLRSLEPASPWGPLPNELLFEIFMFM